VCFFFDLETTKSMATGNTTETAARLLGYIWMLTTSSKIEGSMEEKGRIISH
jgi:hypothetical protein